jgi:lipopolysaccharide exporter
MSGGQASGTEGETTRSTPVADAPMEGESLRRTAVVSLAWSWLGVVAVTAMQLAYTAVMARLLEPKAFGLMAGAMLAIKFVTYLAQFGVGTALIQRPHLDDQDLRVAFTVSLVAGSLGALLVVLVATPLSHLLNQPGIASVTRWLGLGLVFAGFGIVPEALLRKRMKFRTLALVSMAAYLCSNILIAIPLALAGAGVASLVVATVGGIALMSLFMSIAASFVPRLAFDSTRAKRLASFGGVVALTSLLDVIGSSTDTAAVGRMGTGQLGQYSRATFLVALPTAQVTSAANRVIGPGLSRLQSDSRRFGSALTTSLGLTACLVAVPVAFAASAARPLVGLVLGPGWGLASDVLPFVAAASGIGLITQVIASASDARGTVRQRFVAQLVSVVVVVTAIVLTAVTIGSPRAVAVAWMCGEFFRLAVHSVLAVKCLSVRSDALLQRLASAALLAALAAAPGAVLIRWWGWAGFGALALAAIAAAVLLVVAWVAWPSAPYRQDVKRMGLTRAGLGTRRGSSE